MIRRLLYRGVLLVLLGVSAASTLHAAPVACDVITDQDTEASIDKLIPGSFRQMLFFAMIGNCIDKKITFKVPKVVMKQALGAAIFSELKGLTIEPAADIPQTEIVVQYVPYKDGTVGCSAPSPYDNCFAYLPTQNVTIRNVKVTLDPSYSGTPLRGLCIDKEEAFNKPTYSQVVIENSAFDGFADGGVVVEKCVSGITLHKTTFSGSDTGLVVDENPCIIKDVSYESNVPKPPIMGGSDAAVFARTDVKGQVTEYHVRGVWNIPYVDKSNMSPEQKEEKEKEEMAAIKKVAIEFFESDGWAGTKYLKKCELLTKAIDGKWNVECVLQPPLTLPFNYAVTVTNQEGTSMFATGTIPADLAKVPAVTPSTPQPAATPPKVEITDQNPPKVQDNLPTTNQNTPPPLSLSAGSPGAAGCSLIR